MCSRRSQAKFRKASDMSQTYVVFDVETPNAMNHRMSAIGITVMQDSVITNEFSSLVNPETHFDAFNIQLTGITPESVMCAPTFFDLWPTIEPLMSGGLLVAHNAPFDMGVLRKCLSQYGIDWRKFADYSCTCAISRKALPQLPNHKLNTICQALGISLQHHEAASDSRACAEILRHCMSLGVDVKDFIRRYRLSM